jgi:hypothetical protein
VGHLTRTEPEYSKVPDLLLSEVEGFEDSLEYERLNETEQGLPGVVAAAFTLFFVRFQDAEVREGLVDRDATTLADAYRVIEQLARGSDEHVRTLVQDEMFENVRASEATWQRIESQLGQASKTLFMEWRRRNPR